MGETDVNPLKHTSKRTMRLSLDLMEINSLNMESKLLEQQLKTLSLQRIMLVLESSVKDKIGKFFQRMRQELHWLQLLQKKRKCKLTDSLYSIKIVWQN